MMIQERPLPHSKNNPKDPSTLKNQEKTHQRNDCGRELLGVSYQDKLVTTMDEWGKSFNFTRLPGLIKKVQDGDTV